MQLIHGLAARGLVQAVDVLGHDGPAFALALQSCQTQVGRVGLCPMDDELLAVEVKKLRGVGLVERCGRSIVSGGYLKKLLVIQAVHAAEIGDAALGRDARPAEKTMLFVAARISSNAGTMQTAPFAFGFYAL